MLGDLETRLGAIPRGLIENQPERLVPTAEACAVLVWLERVLRVALKKTGPQYIDVSLPTLLRQATGKKRKVLSFPAKYQHLGEIIDGITAFRNGVLHGNLETIINWSVERFYGNEYIKLVEELYEITNHFATQLQNAPAP